MPRLAPPPLERREVGGRRHGKGKASGAASSAPPGTAYLARSAMAFSATGLTSLLITGKQRVSDETSVAVTRGLPRGVEHPLQVGHRHCDPAARSCEVVGQVARRLVWWWGKLPLSRDVTPLAVLLLLPPPPSSLTSSPPRLGLGRRPWVRCIGNAPEDDVDGAAMFLLEAAMI
jgi:hypothetical protein